MPRHTTARAHCAPTSPCSWPIGRSPTRCRLPRARVTHIGVTLLVGAWLAPVEARAADPLVRYQWGLRAKDGVGASAAWAHTRIRGGRDRRGRPRHTALIVSMTIPTENHTATMGAKRADLEYFRPHALFMRSLNPMLIADDDRLFVDANAAARLFFRLPHEGICRLKIDDLTSPDLRPGLGSAWSDFLQSGGSRRGGRTIRGICRCPTARASPSISAPHRSFVPAATSRSSCFPLPASSTRP